MSANQYVGARMAVVDSVTKLVASGFPPAECVRRGVYGMLKNFSGKSVAEAAKMPYLCAQL